MGKLTTHVLDTANGCPAAGVHITLRRIDGDTSKLLADTATNADGRCAQPLLEGSNFQPGTYELSFAVADYFRAKGTQLDDPPFIGDSVVRFGIADPDAHYHVPLLVSPWGYTTYRGS